MPDLPRPGLTDGNKPRIRTENAMPFSALLQVREGVCTCAPILVWQQTDGMSPVITYM